MAVFSKPPDQCFLARRVLPLVRDRSLVTAFHSPATIAASRRPPFRGQSFQPATSLPSRSVSMPVRPFGSTTASSGLRRLRPLHCLWPVALLPTRFGLPRPPSPLASGSFSSLGVKVFNGVCCLPVHLTNPPDFLSLPAARPGESLGCGSVFQVRYVSAGLLFLKPLGTSFTMIPMCFCVNAFLGKLRPYPQHLSGLFRISYSAAAVQVLWIIRR